MSDNQKLITALEAIYIDAKRIQAIDSEIAKLKAEREAFYEEDVMKTKNEELNRLLNLSVSSGVTAFALPNFTGIVAAFRHQDVFDIFSNRSPITFHNI